MTIRQRPCVHVALGCILSLENPEAARHTVTMRSTTIVHAAGGVISRQRRSGRLEVLLIHRPHRRDWTFPKGKLESGETHEECALREVEEETGLRCALGLELPSTSHTDNKGRHKLVRYWMMYPTGGVAGPHNEVDAVQWVSIDQAARILTYPRDRELLTSFATFQGRVQGAAS
jgi:8-oxo-dGTP pyrophosphatase MutT (NUDIX family)